MISLLTTAMGCCFSEPVYLDLLPEEICLDQFDTKQRILAIVPGMWKMRTVQHKATNKVYAMKYFDKGECIQRKTTARVIQERQIMEEIDHPFISKLYFAFQNKKHCFLVLDFLEGGPLREHLNVSVIWEEDQVRIWVAELASALMYIHSRGITNGDIKPDTVMLDMQGHVYLTDFSQAIRTSDDDLYTGGAIGSLPYNAPEVLIGPGCSWEIDWWSLGVLAYELLFHCLPFQARKPQQLRQAILNDPVIFPRTRICSEECLSALRGFLEKDQYQRLGCKNPSRSRKAFRDVQMHPWFRDITWSFVRNKDLPSGPWLPKSGNNFSNHHDLNQFMAPDTSLGRENARRRINLAKLSLEERRFFKEFHAYDYTRLDISSEDGSTVGGDSLHKVSISV